MKLSYLDATHAYWLDGKRCKGISAVAKIPEDDYRLDLWRKRQILIGCALQPQLVERAAAHFDDRDVMDRLAEEAAVAAKSHDAAGRGTAAHRIAERVDLSELIIDTPQARAVQQAWAHALEVADLEIVPDLVERIVVYPDLLIAGRFDRFARRKTDGRLCALDIKTGPNAVKYPHPVAVQCALYANAPLMAGPVGRDGGTTTHFEPLPDVDRTVGYVVHMPNDEQVDVVGVDLEAGWKAAQLCFAVIDWRRKKDLLIPVTEIPVGGEDDVTAPAAGAGRPETTAPASDRSSWIVGRLAEIAATGPDAKELMARAWPRDVPYRAPWTDPQIDLLDRALAYVEGAIDAPFPPTDPASINLNKTYKQIKGEAHAR
jgi:hypothetical protein